MRAFLEKLEKANDLLHIDEELSPRYEVAYVMRELDGGPAIAFYNLRGYSGRILGNLLSTRRRLAWALKVEEKSVVSKLLEALKAPLKCAESSDAPFMEVSEEPLLTKLPVPTFYERDPGPFITAGVVYAEDPETGVGNLSVHRMMVIDDKHLTIRLVPRHLYRMWQNAKKLGKHLDIAIAIGVSPEVLVAASLSPPFGVCEYEVANKLMEGRLRLVRCPHVEAYAPVESEVVIEARILADEMIDEGPFVDLTGTYDIVRKQPLVEAVGVLRRQDFLLQTILPAGNEHKILMGLPYEVRIWEAVSSVVPKVHDVYLTPGGCGYFHAVISIDKQTEGDAKNAIFAAFAAHPSLKHVVVVDGDVDPRDIDQVEWAIATRFQADKDLVVVSHVRGSSLDPSSDQQTQLTSKMGLDATRSFLKPREKFEKASIPRSERAERVVRSVRSCS